MGAWLEQPDAEGWWEVDAPGWADLPAFYVTEGAEGCFMLWVPQSVYYGDTERTGQKLVDTDDPNLLMWWWKRIEVPDNCPIFDGKDDPE